MKNGNPVVRSMLILSIGVLLLGLIGCQQEVAVQEDLGPVFFPPPPVEPADTSDIDAMGDFLKEKKEYDEVVKKIRADHSARVSSFEPEETIFEKGFIAFVALSESGTTTCKFDNAWLWLIK